MAAMENYNHQVGLKIVGEMMPQAGNRVTLADDKDQYGLPIARVEYAWCDNDRKLIGHALDFMTQALQAIDATRHLAADRRYLPHERHRADGQRPARQRGRRRLPKLGHPEFMDLRRVGLSDRRRGQSVADDPGDRLPHRRSYPRDGGARRTGKSELMHEPVRNKVVVVTGGTAGVGRATVEAFAHAGWDVGISRARSRDGWNGRRRRCAGRPQRLHRVG